MSHWTARHASAIIIALLADTRGSCDFGRAADPFLAWAASWTEPAVARLPSEELYCALYLYFWTARYSRKSSRRSARGCCVQLYSVWACYSCTAVSRNASILAWSMLRWCGSFLLYTRLRWSPYFRDFHVRPHGRWPRCPSSS